MPVTIAGAMSEPWQWNDEWGDVRVSLTGREPVESEELQGLAWLQQIHSADVLEAETDGCRGEGDALITRRTHLGLRVVTADCVPVLLAGHQQVAAVHAGWRGVVAKIVRATCARLDETPKVAWIGPAISGEVYEVSHEVSEQVVAASDPRVLRPGLGERPHVDLQHAVEEQLRALGVQEIRTVRECTFQRAEILCSYRRDGAKAGRNRSTIWRVE